MIEPGHLRKVGSAHTWMAEKAGECHNHSLGSVPQLTFPEKGVRNQSCEAPGGPFRLLVPDPFFIDW